MSSIATKTPFLDLPAEIRIKIYDIIAVPTDGPLRDYKGLYLACRQIKEEMDHEVVQSMARYLKGWKAKWAENPSTSGITMTIPATFSATRRVVIDLPNEATKVTDQSGKTSRRLPEGIQDILQLFLDKISVNQVLPKGGLRLEEFWDSKEIWPRMTSNARKASFHIYYDSELGSRR